MKLSTNSIVWLFIFSIFMGVTAISIGFGALFPSMNLIAKPFVCPGGVMQVESQFYRVSPVETVTTLTWYCVDRLRGTKTELGIFPMSLYAGIIYGLLLFFVLFLLSQNQMLMDWLSTHSTGTFHRHRTALEDAEMEYLNKQRKS